MHNEILSERVDLFDPNMYIAITFDVVGGAEAQLLVDAARRAFTGFEATMSRIVLDNTGSAYYEKMQSSSCTAQTTDADLDDLIRENEKKPFAIENGEMIRVFVRQSEDRLNLLVMAHHLAGDGKSVIYFVERMMKEYIGEYGEYQPLKLLNEDTLPAGTNISSLYRLLANYYNRRWLKSGRVFNWDDRNSLYNTYWQERTSIILKQHFPHECVERIRAKSKAAKVSVNSWILAAFMRENRRYLSAGLAVDARIDGNRTMSNQATGITAPYIYSDRLTFEQNAQRLHKRIYTKLNRWPRRYLVLRFIPMFTPSLIDSILMYAYGLYDNRTSRKAAVMMRYVPLKANVLSVTNLTKLDIAEQYGDLHIENLYFVPPVVSYAYQTFGIATTSSGMTATLHSMNDRFAEQERQMFRNTMDFLEG